MPIDIVQRWYATRDERLIATNVQWDVLETFPAGGRYDGRRSVIDTFFPAVASHFTAFDAHVDELHAAGNEVIAVGEYSAVGGDNEQQIRSRFTHLWTVTGGQITRFRQVADTAAFSGVAAASA